VGGPRDRPVTEHSGRTTVELGETVMTGRAAA
jgi:hypothetical protein